MARLARPGPWLRRAGLSSEGSHFLEAQDTVLLPVLGGRHTPILNPLQGGEKKEQTTRSGKRLSSGTCTGSLFMCWSRWDLREQRICRLQDLVLTISRTLPKCLPIIDAVVMATPQQGRMVMFTLQRWMLSLAQMEVNPCLCLRPHTAWVSLWVECLSS